MKNDAAEKMFPIMDAPNVPWRFAEKAYETYRAKFGNDQSLERIAERGGFGWNEYACLYMGHTSSVCHRQCTRQAKIDIDSFFRDSQPVNHGVVGNIKNPMPGIYAFSGHDLTCPECAKRIKEQALTSVNHGVVEALEECFDYLVDPDTGLPHRWPFDGNDISRLFTKPIYPQYAIRYQEIKHIMKQALATVTECKCGEYRELLDRAKKSILSWNAEYVDGGLHRDTEDVNDPTLIAEIDAALGGKDGK